MSVINPDSRIATRYNRLKSAPATDRFAAKRRVHLRPDSDARSPDRAGLLPDPEEEVLAPEVAWGLKFPSDFARHSRRSLRTWRMAAAAHNIRAFRRAFAKRAAKLTVTALFARTRWMRAFFG